MSNQVQVDEIDISKRFEAIGANAAALEDDQDQAEFDRTHDAESWEKGARFVVDMIDAKMCPAWDLEESEKRDLAGALSECLDRWFPGSIAGIDNWHPIAKLGFTAGAISVMRYDWERGGFAPMHRPTREDDDASEQERWQADSSDGGEPDGENGLSFTASSQ